MAHSTISSSDAVSDTRTRPWHLSFEHLGSRTVGDQTPGVDSDETARGEGPSGGTTPGEPGDVAPRADAPVQVLAPLWYRVVTGKVLWWRILRTMNRLLWMRRHAARRALRWLDHHPEIHQILAREGAIRFLVGRFMARWRAAGTPRSAHRPEVCLAPDIDIGALHHHALLTHVDIRRDERLSNAAKLAADGIMVDIQKLGEAPSPASDGETGAALVSVLGPVDVRVWNPTSFRRDPTHGAVRLSSLADSKGDRTARLRVETAQRSVAVVCDRVERYTAAEEGRAVAELAASGVPLCGELSPDVAALLPAQFVRLIASADADLLEDVDVRERHSIELRRLGQRHFSPRGTWARIGETHRGGASSRPEVSVLLASNRPEDVIGAARQVAAQEWVDVQLIVGLHGSHMPYELDERLGEIFPDNLVVRHLDDSLNLGEVMNVLTVEADGALVSKWDDDDWYDDHHLADLVAALDYSGASMVAKAAEFVYLEAADLTLRRFVRGSERFSTTVAGGTLLLHRDDLQQVGWADAPRRVDRLLIEALEERGQTTYRTHGLGYVLRRRGAAMGQHTWQAGDAYFLRQAHDQRRGLDLGFAGFHRIHS